jgi:hypothetical protein
MARTITYARALVGGGLLALALAGRGEIRPSPDGS